MAKLLDVEFSSNELDEYLIKHFNNLNETLKRKIWRDWSNYMRKKTSGDYWSGKQPDGKDFVPAKWQKRKMFIKLAKSSRLATREKKGFLQLGYFNTTGRIASVHHFGLVEKFTRGFLKGKTVKYPKRELLGVTKKDLKELEILILGALDK